MPLHVEILYNEYKFVAAFAVASLLALLALVTLVAQDARRMAQHRASRASRAGDRRMSIEVRNISKRFGDVRRARRRRPATSRPASWSRCSGRRARARPRCCASSPGWRQPDAGTRRCSTARTRPARTCGERQVGFVFQHYALFRHMTVFENVAFGLRVRPRAQRPAEAEIRDAGRRAARAGAARLARRPLSARSSPAASGSASRWPARWPSSRGCCCSTSRSARSTPRCARSCAAGCAGCTTRCTSPACSSPTTRRRRSRWPTAWW